MDDQAQPTGQLRDAAEGFGAPSVLAQQESVIRGNMEIVPMPTRVSDEVARIFRERGFSSYRATE